MNGNFSQMFYMILRSPGFLFNLLFFFTSIFQI